MLGLPNHSVENQFTQESVLDISCNCFTHYDTAV